MRTLCGGHQKSCAAVELGIRAIFAAGLHHACLGPSLDRLVKEIKSWPRGRQGDLSKESYALFQELENAWQEMEEARLWLETVASAEGMRLEVEEVSFEKVVQGIDIVSYLGDGMVKEVYEASVSFLNKSIDPRVRLEGGLFRLFPSMPLRERVVWLCEKVKDRDLKVKVDDVSEWLDIFVSGDVDRKDRIVERMVLEAPYEVRLHRWNEVLRVVAAGGVLGGGGEDDEEARSMRREALCTSPLFSLTLLTLPLDSIPTKAWETIIHGLDLLLSEMGLEWEASLLPISCIHNATAYLQTFLNSTHPPRPPSPIPYTTTLSPRTRVATTVFRGEGGGSEGGGGEGKVGGDGGGRDVQMMVLKAAPSGASTTPLGALVRRNECVLKFFGPRSGFAEEHGREDGEDMYWSREETYHHEQLFPATKKLFLEFCDTGEMNHREMRGHLSPRILVTRRGEVEPFRITGGVLMGKFYFAERRAVEFLFFRDAASKKGFGDGFGLRASPMDPNSLMPIASNCAECCFDEALCDAEELLQSRQRGRRESPFEGKTPIKFILDLSGAEGTLSVALPGKEFQVVIDTIDPERSYHLLGLCGSFHAPVFEAIEWLPELPKIVHGDPSATEFAPSTEAPSLAELHADDWVEGGGDVIWTAGMSPKHSLVATASLHHNKSVHVEHHHLPPTSLPPMFTLRLLPSGRVRLDVVVGSQAQLSVGTTFSAVSRSPLPPMAWSEVEVELGKDVLVLRVGKREGGEWGEEMTWALPLQLHEPLDEESGRGGEGGESGADEASCLVRRDAWRRALWKRKSDKGSGMGDAWLSLPGNGLPFSVGEDAIGVELGYPYASRHSTHPLPSSPPFGAALIKSFVVTPLYTPSSSPRPIFEWNAPAKIEEVVKHTHHPPLSTSQTLICLGIIQSIQSSTTSDGAEEEEKEEEEDEEEEEEVEDDRRGGGKDDALDMVLETLSVPELDQKLRCERALQRVLESTAYYSPEWRSHSALHLAQIAGQIGHAYVRGASCLLHLILEGHGEVWKDAIEDVMNAANGEGTDAVVYLKGLLRACSWTSVQDHNVTTRTPLAALSMNTTDVIPDFRTLKGEFSKCILQGLRSTSLEAQFLAVRVLPGATALLRNLSKELVSDVVECMYSSATSDWKPWSKEAWEHAREKVEQPWSSPTSLWKEVHTKEGEKDVVERTSALLCRLYTHNSHTTLPSLHTPPPPTPSTPPSPTPSQTPPPIEATPAELMEWALTEEEDGESGGGRGEGGGEDEEVVGEEYFEEEGRNPRLAAGPGNYRPEWSPGDTASTPISTPRNPISQATCAIRDATIDVLGDDIVEHLAQRHLLVLLRAACIASLSLPELLAMAPHGELSHVLMSLVGDQIMLRGISAESAVVQSITTAAIERGEVAEAFGRNIVSVLTGSTPNTLSVRFVVTIACLIASKMTKMIESGGRASLLPALRFLSTGVLVACIRTSFYSIHPLACLCSSVMQKYSCIPERDGDENVLITTAFRDTIRGLRNAVPVASGLSEPKSLARVEWAPDDSALHEAMEPVPRKDSIAIRAVSMLHGAALLAAHLLGCNVSKLRDIVRDLSGGPLETVTRASRAATELSRDPIPITALLQVLPAYAAAEYGRSVKCEGDAREKRHWVRTVQIPGVNWLRLVFSNISRIEEDEVLMIANAEGTEVQESCFGTLRREWKARVPLPEADMAFWVQPPLDKAPGIEVKGEGMMLGALLRRSSDDDRIALSTMLPAAETVLERGSVDGDSSWPLSREGTEVRIVAYGSCEAAIAWSPFRPSSDPPFPKAKVRYLLFYTRAPEDDFFEWSFAGCTDETKATLYDLPIAMKGRVCVASVWVREEHATIPCHAYTLSEEMIVEALSRAGPYSNPFQGPPLSLITGQYGCDRKATFRTLGDPTTVRWTRREYGIAISPIGIRAGKARVMWLLHETSGDGPACARVGFVRAKLGEDKAEMVGIATNNGHLATDCNPDGRDLGSGVPAIDPMHSGSPLTFELEAERSKITVQNAHTDVSIEGDSGGGEAGGGGEGGGEGMKKSGEEDWSAFYFPMLLVPGGIDAKGGGTMQLCEISEVNGGPTIHPERACMKWFGDRMMRLMISHGGARFKMVLKGAQVFRTLRERETCRLVFGGEAKEGIEREGFEAAIIPSIHPEEFQLASDALEGLQSKFRDDVRSRADDVEAGGMDATAATLRSASAGSGGGFFTRFLETLSHLTGVGEASAGGAVEEEERKEVGLRRVSSEGESMEDSSAASSLRHAGTESIVVAAALELAKLACSGWPGPMADLELCQVWGIAARAAGWPVPRALRVRWSEVVEVGGEVTTWWESHSLLPSCPTSQIAARLAMLQRFNSVVLRALPWSVDIHQGAHCIFPPLAEQFFEKHLTTGSGASSLSGCISLRREDASESLLSQATIQIVARGKESAIALSNAQKDTQTWHIVYEGEAGSDAGGLWRDSFAAFAESAMKHPNAELVPTPNSKLRYGEFQEWRMPRPQDTSPSYLQSLFFLGQLLGVSLRNGIPCPVSLPSFLWKALLSQTPREEDLVLVDKRASDTIARIATGDASDVDRRWVFPDWDGNEVEVIVGGKEKEVKREDVEAFSAAVVQHRLVESLAPQISAICDGFWAVVPKVSIRLFSWRMLEEKVAGSTKVSLQDLERIISCAREHKPRLFEVLERLSHKERSMFLRFGTGIGRVPNPGKEDPGLWLRVTIATSDIFRIPTAAVCSNVITMNSCASTKEMLRAVKIALSEVTFQNA